jgi:uncharacterized protein (DUF2252 family)
MDGEHLTRAEREARGTAARASVPRSTHAVFEPQPGRPDPVDLLESQAATRIPELVPIRYGRMLASPLAFYRGAALIMASDLASTPRSGLRAQLCGDAHLSNFGSFASPERHLVFDVNDFDETLPGPWEWDVKRLAASIVVAGRDNGHPAAARRNAVLATVRVYRDAMRGFAKLGSLDLWYAQLDLDDPLGRRFRRQADPRQELAADVARARKHDNLQAFEKLTHLVEGEPRITSDPPLLVPVTELAPEHERDELESEMRRLIRGYGRTMEAERRHLLGEFRFADMARKVVGVGSVGLRDWIVLMLGRDAGDPLFLQVKQAGPSVLEQFVGKSRHRNSGQRVVSGQRLMQAASDIFLGWKRVTDPDGQVRDYYVRQLRDWKGSVVIDRMTPANMAIYGRMCGWTVSRAHARSGECLAIAAYLGKGDVFDRAIADFAEAYADQNERDYEALHQAVAAGRITAQPGL